jgi:two-component system OmpR family response regulator
MRLLLAEDDTAIAAMVAAALVEAGYAVDRAEDGVQAEFLGQTERYDAAIVDIGLPQLDGLAVLQRWRDAGLALPVLMLTARTRWHDKLAGFDAGADDYLTKPFQLEELIVRVRALIRRAAGHAAPQLRCGPLLFDVNAARFSLDGVPLTFTAHEFRILAYLMHHPGKLVTRAELGEHVYEGGFDPDSNVIDVLIGRIRRKLGAALIHTVRGQGFRLSDSE